MKYSQYNLYQFTIPALLGSAAFFFALDKSILNVGIDHWLLHRNYDSLTHYLGWVFYRDSHFQWPPGANFRYGIELSSSIVYSDSIPLLAIFFKAFSFILPTKFQYFGIWILLCFVLQSYLAWTWLGNLTRNTLTRSLATGFFLFIPSMLWRIEMHEALIAHFLILGAYVLIFNQRLCKNRSLWALLIVISSLIQFYLCIMILALWLANLFDRWGSESNYSVKTFSFDIFASLAALLIAMYLGGYFTIPLASTTSRDLGQFGDYPNNLLSFFYPNGWSYLWNGIPQKFINFEGFNYLGLGIICLLPIAIIGLLKHINVLHPLMKGHGFVVGSVIFMYIFSLSNSVHIGFNVYEIPMPEFATQLLGIIRCSGRMAWPLTYLLLYCLLAILIKTFNPKLTGFLLFSALTLQIGDTSAGWLKIRDEISSQNAVSHKLLTTDPFWSLAAKHYPNLKVSPTLDKQWQERWEHLAKIAALNRQNTNAVYLARINYSAVELTNRKFWSDLISSKFDDYSIYVVDDAYPLPIKVHMNPEKDLLTQIDNFKIFAPNWFTCAECKNLINSSMVNAQDIEKLKNTENISLNNSNHFMKWYLAGGHGWEISPEGVTPHANQTAKIVIPVAEPTNAIRLRYHARNNCPELPLQIRMEGNVNTTLQTSNGNFLDIPIAIENIKKGVIFLDVKQTDNVAQKTNPNCRPYIQSLQLIK